MKPSTHKIITFVVTCILFLTLLISNVLPSVTYADSEGTDGQADVTEETCTHDLEDPDDVELLPTWFGH